MTMQEIKPYDLSADPVFSKFVPWHGEVAAGFDVNFVGQLTDVSFNKGWDDAERMTDRYCWPPYPPIDEEIFEWKILLSGILAARDSFTMIEAGAGYGRWLVSAARASQLRGGDLNCRLIGIEADPTHFKWMRKHFLDNGLDPDSHRLIFGAVDEKDGEDIFVCGDDPSSWYGQHVAYADHHRMNLNDGYKRITVPTFSIDTILSNLDRVDLMDFDIQYAEGRAIPASIETMTHKVKRVFVETHSAEIHDIVFDSFRSYGWKRTDTYGYANGSPSLEVAPVGLISFRAGLQCWVNRNVADDALCIE
jgi:FkbM family methyltransferase